MSAAKGQKFSPESLLRIRRMRRARRLFAQVPLFAFATMQQEYPDYTLEAFSDDLRRRSPKKKRKGRSGLMRFGRWHRMQQHLCQYLATGDIDQLSTACQLRKNMTKPYRMRITIAGRVLCYQFDPTIAVRYIEELCDECKKCSTPDQVEQLVDRFNGCH